MSVMPETNPLCLKLFARPLRRPRLLVETARHGLPLWRRNRDLRRLLPGEDIPSPKANLARLYPEEQRLDRARQSGAADYQLRRHILILIAILAERGELAAETAPTLIFPAKTSRAHP
ncbi:DUF6477 family protein [Paracoccus aminophilus]|uniref:Uncharacterized protein n=1 Tax=Paracoccus aminophilus JCM 7686 TaxID=1367847 RepID=S5XYI6_PARAH|nr:DUF6477 family protein [Paracoccus aminophilus]AGT08495.1 hypothetical protein JCM7686_1394 [Paracoccus aminophilus JCM 7686]